MSSWRRRGRPTAAVDCDRWDRIVATCIRNDGVDVNEWLVREGWALDWPRYSDGAYSRVQEEARIDRRGMWQGAFVDPRDWRAGARLDWTVASEPVDPDCVIKGNINARGERIYHVPGGQFYDQTVIDEAAGQRWFCSEDGAREAGWRPSRR